MPPLEDHPQRYSMVHELHARPFLAIEAPCHAVHLVVKEPVDAASRDRARDRAHLLALLDRHGAAHPQPAATHWSDTIGRNTLKWESHNEFVTYSVFAPGLMQRAFDPAAAEVFAADWLAAAPGRRLCAMLIRVERMPADEGEVLRCLDDWFVEESLAASVVIEGQAIIAGDFRIDPAGFMRFAVFVQPGVGARRIGRIVQRLCEIETYRAMSMLGLTRARDLSARLNALDPPLTALAGAMQDEAATAEGTLNALLRISGELESLAVAFSYRAGATAAYEAIVNERVAALREVVRFGGRQTFAEFMQRRYDPAMRTVKSTERRLYQMLDRAARAAELLRTRVDVERTKENQALLASLDRRADLQLRLQRTVEGLSVVAISYYAVNLAANLAYPAAEPLGLTKGALIAALTPPVVLAVWLLVRRIRQGLHG